MLPKTGNILEQDFEVAERPSRTYRLNADAVTGRVDQLEAVKQAVYCILNIERYDWLIYSWNYGVELKDLFGKPIGLVKSKIKKRIKEALMQDDRIQGVDAFSFAANGRRLSVRFTVHSIYGDMQAEKEVKI